MNSKNANLSFTISSKKELIELKIIVDFHWFDISKYYKQRTRFLTVLHLYPCILCYIILPHLHWKLEKNYER